MQQRAESTEGQLYESLVNATYSLERIAIVPLDSNLAPAVYSSGLAFQVLTMQECRTLMEDGIVYRKQYGIRFAVVPVDSRTQYKLVDGRWSVFTNLSGA